MKPNFDWAFFMPFSETKEFEGEYNFLPHSSLLTDC